MSQKNRFESLFSPESIAIVGLSPDSISSIALRLLMEGGFNGRIFPVDPDMDSIFGVQCFNSLSDLPEYPDLVYLEKMKDKDLGMIEEITKIHTSHLILGPGIDLPTARYITARIGSEAGTRVLGPESMGFVNITAGVCLTNYPLDCCITEGDGEIALVAQDGTLGFSLYTTSADSGLSFRYVVTTGKEVDITCLDIGEYLLEDENVRFLVFCFHELKEGRRFLELVRKAGEQGVPVAILRSPEPNDREIVTSKQDPITDGASVWHTVFQKYGVIEISGPEDLIDLGSVFSMKKNTLGKRVGIISTSADSGDILSQLCISCGLSVPELVPGDVWLENISGRNPFHIPSHLLHDKSILPLALKWLSGRNDIDIIVLVISFMNPDWDDKDLAKMVQILKETPKPAVCCCLPGGKITGRIRSLLDACGVPVFSSFRRCARALGALQMEGKGVAKIPQLPLSLDITHELPDKLTEYHAKHLLSKYGVEITREQLCRDLQEALEAADVIGYPVALKVMSPNIIQKSQARIIALDLKDHEEVRNAYGRTIQRAIAENPEAEIIGVLIQEMLETGIECMISASRDPVFGPVISVGLGGIYVEFLYDRSTRIAPVDIDTALEMITELKGFPILKGLWGQSGYDIGSLARVVSQVSRILFVEEGLKRISINPVFVRENDAVVVDAFIIRG